MKVTLSLSLPIHSVDGRDGKKYIISSAHTVYTRLWICFFKPQHVLYDVYFCFDQSANDKITREMCSKLVCLCKRTEISLESFSERKMFWLCSQYAVSAKFCVISNLNSLLMPRSPRTHSMRLIVHMKCRFFATCCNSSFVHRKIEAFFERPWLFSSR